MKQSSIRTLSISACIVVAVCLVLCITIPRPQQHAPWTPPKISDWKVTNYVDDFGDPTKGQYITYYCTGKFCNTATTDSPLGVKFLVDGSDEICIMLYEYLGKNPVKGYKTLTYEIKIKADTSRISLEGYLYEGSDRLIVGIKEHQEGRVTLGSKLHKALLKYPYLKFFIVEDGSPTNTYSFEVDTYGYGEAFKQLTGK